MQQLKTSKRENLQLCLLHFMTVKQAELKALVKRQLQLHTKVYQQKGIQISLTEKGKPKSAQELLNELSKVITKYPVQSESIAEKASHQMLHVFFDRPSLLAGCRIKHQFEEDSCLVWYEGVIVSCRKRCVSVHYPDANEDCQFTLDEIKDDFYFGDLIVDSLIFFFTLAS